MSTFKIHTLGCGSAKPSLRHQPSCTVVEYRGNLFMIDCGEGAQLAFQKAGLKFSRLGHIFLTHLHGDHVLGLPGLIASLGLGGCGGSIAIHTFEEGKEILSVIFDFFSHELPFDVNFNIIKPEEKTIFDNGSISVRTIPLRHRVPTVGYVFEEKPKPRHIIRAMTDFHKVPVAMMKSIKDGQDFIKPDGTVIKNSVLTTPPSPALSYAHISDTAYVPSIAEKIGPVDLLFHETTYLEQHLHEAKMRYHSTAMQAAEIALKAGAKSLLTGHYSTRYKNDDEFRKEAESVFPNVILNKEGLTVALD